MTVRAKPLSISTLSQLQSFRCIMTISMPCFRHRRQQLVDTVLEGCSSFHMVLLARAVTGRQALLGIAHRQPSAAPKVKLSGPYNTEND